MKIAGSRRTKFAITPLSWATVENGTLKWKGTEYELSGARARVESSGFRGQKYTVVVDGPRVQIAFPVIRDRGTAYSLSTAINNQAILSN